MENREYCLFCDKDNLQRHRIILENELFYARWDNNAISEGHAEVVSKKHIVSFFELNEKEILQLHELINKVREIIDKEYHPDGYNLGCNDGEIGSRTMRHLHLHIIPRYFEDYTHI
ncbi:MAG: HIT family protein [Patescibacteria group bacterium]